MGWAEHWKCYLLSSGHAQNEMIGMGINMLFLVAFCFAQYFASWLTRRFHAQRIAWKRCTPTCYDMTGPSVRFMTVCLSVTLTVWNKRHLLTAYGNRLVLVFVLRTCWWNFDKIASVDAVNAGAVRKIHDVRRISLSDYSVTRWATEHIASSVHVAINPILRSSSCINAH